MEDKQLLRQLVDAYTEAMERRTASPSGKREWSLVLTKLDEARMWLREAESVDAGPERQPILGEVPTEFFEGEWHFPTADGPEPWAVITYTDEPSPETGDVGWCWWALGMMGDAPTYEGAKRTAETWIQARINGMPASGRWA